MSGGDDTADFTGALVPVFLDGGAGNDTLDFPGADASETYLVSKDGPDGFRLHRDAENVTMLAQSVELLELDTKHGTDVVSTISLRTTEQHITGGPSPAPTSLTVDADGRCLTRLHRQRRRQSAVRRHVGRRPHRRHAGPRRHPCRRRARPRHRRRR
jgi:hypothetical protein